MSELPNSPRKGERVLPWAKRVHRFMHGEQSVPGGTTRMTRSHGGTSYSRIPLFPLIQRAGNAADIVTATSSGSPKILTLNSSVYIDDPGVIRAAPGRLILGRKFSRYMVWGRSSFRINVTTDSFSASTNVNFALFQGASNSVLADTLATASVGIMNDIVFGVDFVAKTTTIRDFDADVCHLSTFRVVKPITDDEREIKIGAWMTNIDNVTSVVAHNPSETTTSLMAVEIP